MKEFLKIMLKDIQDEHFTKSEFIIYGILTPIMLFLLMAFAGWMDGMSGV